MIWSVKERHKTATPNCVPQGESQTYALLSLLRMYRIYFCRAKLLIITFKIILQVLEMDMAVSAIIE